MKKRNRTELLDGLAKNPLYPELKKLHRFWIACAWCFGGTEKLHGLIKCTHVGIAMQIGCFDHSIPASDSVS
jgi:hypothetical protein